MSDFLSETYFWTKAFHVISVISWMAGLLYLPRIFVYHASGVEEGSGLSETFKVMERKLLRFIMNPAMVTTWLFGIALAFTPGVVNWGSDFWFYIKLVMILILSWYHHWLGKRRKEFLADRNTRSSRTYRLMNEVPTVLMIVVVIMVIVKPF